MNEHSFIYIWKLKLAMADRKTRKKLITVERRTQILKAATDVFTRKGFSAATMPEIAAGAGMAVGTIYLYYPSKRELLIATIKNLIVTAPLLDLIYRIPRENIAVVFGQIMKNRFDLIQSEEMSRMPTLMGEVIRDPELKALWTERFFKPLFTQFEGIYRAMTPPGTPGRIEPAVAVRAAGGLIIGFLMIKLLEGEFGPLSDLPQEKVAADMANFMLHGLMGSENQALKQEEKQ
jgi:AcrR family transcriptional regulator